MAPQFTNSCYCRSPHTIYTPTHQDHGDVGPFPCHYGLRMNGLGTTHYSLLHVNHLYASNLLVSHLLHCLDFSWYCLISASMLCTLREDLILAHTNCSSPVTAEKVTLFVAYLGSNRLYISTIQSYMVALRHFQALEVPPCIVTFFPFTSHGSSPAWNHSAPITKWHTTI